MRRGLVLVLAVVLLTGCHEQWGGSISGGGNVGADGEVAQSNLRATIPAIEAYYADNGTYAGITLALLRAEYDVGLPDVDIVQAEARTYCIESTVGSASYFKPGPMYDIVPGKCGDPVPEAPPPPPPVNSGDAATNVRLALPAIGAWSYDHGTYEGMTIDKLRSQYDYGIPTSGLELVRVRRDGYCIQSSVGGETYSFAGPKGPLAQGPC